MGVLVSLCMPSDCKSTLSLAAGEGLSEVLGSLENQPYLQYYIESDTKVKLHNPYFGLELHSPLSKRNEKDLYLKRKTSGLPIAA